MGVSREDQRGGNQEVSAKIPRWMGRLPFPSGEKKPVKIASQDVGETDIYGEGRERMCCHTYVSTDKILISHWVVPPGQSFQPADIHSGDEPYYILQGEAHVFNPETGQLAQAKEGDIVFIPRKTWHQVYNFTDEDVIIVAIIAGKPWEQQDMEQVEKRGLTPVYFKGARNA
jgi:mannose-6-phosphate isomerase-like protein (cupin superfamily)